VKSYQPISWLRAGTGDGFDILRDDFYKSSLILDHDVAQSACVFLPARKIEFSPKGTFHDFRSL
jgi:hypothetical protein